MRLTVRHSTVYTYDTPISYLIQAIRLTPRPHDGLMVRRWSVTAESGRVMPEHVDGFGNIVHTHTVHTEALTATVTVEGEVDTADTFGIIRGAVETLDPAFYLSESEQTRADPAITAMALDVAKARLAGPELLHALMLRIRQRIAFQTGETHVHTTGAEALRDGAGVCQDHAHVFIAAARALGFPARYVSGYLWTGNDDVSPASHAWGEAFVSELGWVGFDIANRVCPTDAYVRVAVGRDYHDAAPVRGVRRGGHDERMSVSVRVAAQQAAQQQ